MIKLGTWSPRSTQSVTDWCQSQAKNKPRLMQNRFWGSTNRFPIQFDSHPKYISYEASRDSLTCKFHTYNTYRSKIDFRDLLDHGKMHPPPGMLSHKRISSTIKHLWFNNWFPCQAPEMAAHAPQATHPLRTTSTWEEQRQNCTLQTEKTFKPW